MQGKPLKNKEDVLGAIVNPKSEGGFIVSKETAKKPLCYDGSVTRCFCLGCGYSTELVAEQAENLAKKAGEEIPANWSEYYFEAKKCSFCSETYHQVSLKKI